jgi:hypothetical protein
MPAKRKPEPRHPVHKCQSGSVQLAVWENDANVDGEERTFYTITMERSYMDRNDEWQKTSQLRQNDLGDAIACLQSAQQFLIKVGD